MAEYELSILEGDNTVEITEGDNTVTLGMGVPVQSYLGVPPSGSFTDGEIVTWDASTTTAQAIDDLNRALKTVSETTLDATLGTPTDGTFTDGYAAISSDTLIVDAVDALNEGLSGVALLAQLPETFAAATGGRNPSVGYAQGFSASTRLANAVIDINQALSGVSAAALAADSKATSANALAQDPGAQPLGTPAGGFSPGYATINNATPIVAAVDKLNQAAATLSGLISTLSTGLSDIGDAQDALDAVAHAPGQQPAKAPTGGWSVGYNALGDATHIADALNLNNAGLLAVSGVAHAPGAQPLGTPAGGFSPGYAAIGTSTLINAAINLLNAGIASVQTQAADAGVAAAAASLAAASASSASAASSAAAQAAAATADSALSTANAAAADAANPGPHALGTPAGGFSTGYASLTAATAINAAVNTLNAGLASVAASANSARTLGTPIDGSFADGLVGLSAGANVTEVIDVLNEAGLALISDGYTFGGLTLTATTALKWLGRSRIASNSDGTLQLTDSALNPGIYQGAKFATSLTDNTVQYGDTTGTGLAVGASALALKVGNQSALSITSSLATSLAGAVTLLTSGTASATAFGFAAGTGLFSPAANELAWSTAGTQRLRINASGLFGINADPVAGTMINITAPNNLNTEYTLSIINAAADRWLRWRNDGRLMVQPYLQCNNLVLGIWGNSAIGNTTGSYLDFSNNIATTPVSLISAASMSVNPTFLFNARSSASTLDIARWQQNGSTVANMTNGGAWNAPGFYANSTQAAAGTVVWGDSGLTSGMGVNTTNSSLTLRTASTDALVIDAAQNATLAAAASLLWNGRGGIAANSDGVFQLKNAAGTSASLNFGPTTSSGARLALTGAGALTLQTGTGSTVGCAFNATTLSATTQLIARASRLWETSGSNVTVDSNLGNQAVTLSASASSTVQVSLTGGTLRAVMVKVTTALTGTGLTGFNIGDTGSTPIAGASTSATAFGSNVAIAAGTATGMASYTVAMPRTYTGTVNIVITPVGATTFTGAMRVSWVIDTFTGPSS